jgi:GNAT superfamily N-acetyltransferase
LRAWRRSWPALVATEEDAVIGFLRAVSDGAVTTYVAELLVAPAHRGSGIGAALLAVCQLAGPGTRLDLLAADASRAYYGHLGFRSLPGFRRSWADEGG